MPWSRDEARARVARTEALLAGLEELPGPAAREVAADALHAVVALYGECLTRILAQVDEATAAELAADELVGHLLLVHDLHPRPAADRVRRALATLRPAQAAELTSLEGTVARVRLDAAGCGCSADRARQQVRDAVTWAAPEIEHVELQESAPAAAQALIPVEALFRAGAGGEKVP
ncbi:NifU family protein [Streptomyces sp. NPDC049555]|uniref:NifU family protein n=1 Tax=Streptomyces sp. NPDC049555 TaxID=3154930 RepID=UPI003445E3F2